MSQINVDENYFDHIKSKRLKARLGDLADVLPIRLWCYAAKHHPENGILKGYTAPELASLIEYTGNAENMLLALLEFNFLLKTAPDTYKINQWEDYQGHIISFKRRGKMNAEKRWGLNTKNADSTANSNAPTKLTKLTKANTPKNFMVPTVEEARVYCMERHNTVDAQRWHDFYTAKNWLIGKNKMKDWKAAIRTWEKPSETKKVEFTKKFKSDCFMCQGTGRMGGGSECSCWK